MNRIFTLKKLLAFVLIVTAFLTACKKTGNTPADSNTNKIDSRYPIFTRDGDTLGYFRIQDDNNGLAIVTLEKLPSWMFSMGQTYEVAFYDGPTFNDIYSQLQQLTVDTASWKTHPVKEHGSGKTVRADELVKMAGLELTIAAPSEVVGIGNIK